MVTLSYLAIMAAHHSFSFSGKPSPTASDSPPAARSFGWRELFALVLEEKRLFVLGLIAMAVGSGVNLLIPDLIRRLLNSDLYHYLVEKPGFTSAVIVGLFAVQAVGFYYRSKYFQVMGQSIVARLRRRLFDAVLQRDVEFFDRSRSADLVSRLGSDAQMIQDAVSVKLSVFIRYSFQVAVGIVLMLLLSVKLTLAIVVAVPMLIAVSITLGRKLKAASKLQQHELGISTAVADESFSGARIVKAFNREEYQMQRYRAAVERVLAAGLRRTNIASFFASFVSFLMNAAIVLVLFYGVALVNAGTMTIGDLTAFLLYGVIVAVSFAFVAGGYAEFVQALGAGERMFELLTPSETTVLRAVSRALPEQLRGAIEFSNVTFAYPSRPDAPVLRDVSFTIPPRSTAAIVGPSGAGKTTLISLLVAWYYPSGGRIAIDDIDIASIDPHELRTHLALVPQDPQLFALSIADNLRFGKSDASLEEMREVCRKARILEFIDQLPAGFETPVGERGVLLSGGQKQRLAIARALLRDPEILVLDEATSALDSENEFAIHEAIREAMVDRTVIIIAHRLSTVKGAGQVIVLEHGAVVQTGTHDSLSRAEGLYRQLVERQELRA